MRRRDFVKAMMAASVSAKAMLAQQLPPATKEATVSPSDEDDPEVPRVRGLMDAKTLALGQFVPDAVAETNADFFTHEQLATLRRMCEVLMPPSKGMPGAVDAGTPEFLDFLIGVSPADRQQLYRAGLDRLDGESRKKFAKPFSAARAQEVDELLRPWLRVWVSDHPPHEPYEKFINVAHTDIRMATTNSDAWSRASKAAGHKDDYGLYWFPVEADVSHPRAAKRALRPVRS